MKNPSLAKWPTVVKNSHSSMNCSSILVCTRQTQNFCALTQTVVKSPQHKKHWLCTKRNTWVRHLLVQIVTLCVNGCSIYTNTREVPMVQVIFVSTAKKHLLESHNYPDMPTNVQVACMWNTHWRRCYMLADRDSTILIYHIVHPLIQGLYTFVLFAFIGWISSK